MKVVIDGVVYAPKLTIYGDKVPPLHKLFAAARKHLGLPLRKVAEMAGMSTNTVHYAEAGGQCSLYTAAKLCDLYGIDFNDVAKSVLAHTEKG